METVYLTLEQALDIHQRTVDVSGGGARGALDTGKLESCLEHMQNDLYYPTFEEKLTHLFFCANKFHCFEDGNKRLALSLGAQFLLFNGYVLVVGSFMKEMENISYHVAAGNIDKDFLQEIITAVLNGDEEDEALKLKILHAISKDL